MFGQNYLYCIQTIKQYAARTSLTLWVEDVGKSNLLKDIAQMRYDDGQIYVNNKVQNKGRFTK